MKATTIRAPRTRQGAAKLRPTASSVALVASGYEYSLRPWEPASSLAGTPVPAMAGATELEGDR